MKGNAGRSEDGRTDPALELCPIAFFWTYGGAAFGHCAPKG